MAKLEDVAKGLGEPVIDELPELVQKLRRNLLISSSFALIYLFADIKIERTAPLGVEVSGLSQSVVDISLLILVLYNLAHFVWHCVDHLGIWRIHLTGTRLRFRTGAHLGSPDGDYPDDPTQSNLYMWWQEEAQLVVSLKRFDKWFRNFKISQILRLFVMEFALPCILGIVTLIGIFMRLLG